MTERLVVVGGDAAGMSAATNARRRRPDLEIVALERGRWTSYSACGIPFYLGGEVDSLDDLVARTADEHRRNGIDIRLSHEVVGIDLDRRELAVVDRWEGGDYRLAFDVLMIGTGARPRRLHVPGGDLEHVHGVQTLDDAAQLVAHADVLGSRRVVVAGGGYVGLEIAEAFLNRGAEVTVVDRASQVMGTLDADMGALVSEAMRARGIQVLCETEITAIDRSAVHTTGDSLPADLVVLGLGVVPNAELAADAGIRTGDRGAILVDDQQRTSADGVFAGGDCATARHLVLDRPIHLALGTVANRAGRVAGTVIGGGDARFPGVLGTAVTKLCDTEIARTGLAADEAAEEGFAVGVGRIESSTRAHYFPGAGAITVKLVAERGTGRLIGGQIVGAEGAAKRIDVVAAAITAGMTVEQVADLDLSYAPPFSPLWDPVAIAARAAADEV